MDKWMLLLSKFGYPKHKSYIYTNKIIKMGNKESAIEWLFLMLDNPTKITTLINYIKK